MQKYYLICDYREKSIFNGQKNDHYSLKSINDIIETLNLLGYDCSYFGGVKELVTAIQTDKFDKAGIYLNFNDGLFSNSKRGQTPILLEMMNVTYSGSSPLTHLAVSDKFFTNSFLKNKIENLLIPNCALIQKEEDLSKLKLSFPIILKPNNEGSSIGISNDSLCTSFNACIEQFNHIKKFNRVIAQKYVNGFELTNYFIRNNLNDITFNEILLISKKEDKTMNNEIFTYDDKINHNRKYYNPREVLSNKQINNIKKITEQIANKLDILTFGRIDYKFFQDKLYFIEANTIPAFSLTSDIGEICRLYKYSYANILELLIKSLG